MDLADRETSEYQQRMKEIIDGMFSNTKSSYSAIKIMNAGIFPRSQQKSIRKALKNVYRSHLQQATQKLGVSMEEVLSDKSDIPATDFYCDYSASEKIVVLMLRTIAEIKENAAILDTLTFALNKKKRFLHLKVAFFENEMRKATRVFFKKYFKMISVVLSDAIYSKLEEGLTAKIKELYRFLKALDLHRKYTKGITKVLVEKGICVVKRSENNFSKIAEIVGILKGIFSKKFSSALIQGIFSKITEEIPTSVIVEKIRNLEDLELINEIYNSEKAIVSLEKIYRNIFILIKDAKEDLFIQIFDLYRIRIKVAEYFTDKRLKTIEQSFFKTLLSSESNIIGISNFVGCLISSNSPFILPEKYSKESLCSFIALIENAKKDELNGIKFAIPVNMKKINDFDSGALDDGTVISLFKKAAYLTVAEIIEQSKDETVFLRRMEYNLSNRFLLHRSDVDKEKWFLSFLRPQHAEKMLRIADDVQKSKNNAAAVLQSENKISGLESRMRCEYSDILSDVDEDHTVKIRKISGNKRMLLMTAMKWPEFANENLDMPLFAEMKQNAENSLLASRKRVQWFDSLSTLEVSFLGAELKVTMAQYHFITLFLQNAVSEAGCFVCHQNLMSQFRGVNLRQVKILHDKGLFGRGSECITLNLQNKVKSFLPECHPLKTHEASDEVKDEGHPNIHAANEAKLIKYIKREKRVLRDMLEKEFSLFEKSKISKYLESLADKQYIDIVGDQIVYIP
ncbi:hypothetical protein ENBRE01_0976 [Enteropsectra breve]|nr:hypothetical protein ENBRE01_0976 [Enteropsectra breve]